VANPRLENVAPCAHVGWAIRPDSRKDAPLSLTQDAPTAQKRTRKRATVKSLDTAPSPLESPLAKMVTTCLEDAKAEDVVGIELAGRTTLADAMFVATGRSSTHVGAIADKIVKACRDGGFRTPRVEGQPLNDWVLIDAGDVIVHVFRLEIRQFYNLEKMWAPERPAEPRALPN
jgi:ribosome silencing factor RsfS/YbeB/iojap